MLRVTEMMINGRSVFAIEDTFDKSKNRVIKYTVNIVTKDNITYFILYDSKMNIEIDVFRYLMRKHQQLSHNTIKHSLYDLKLLFTFADILEKKINEFNELDIISFMYFLSGTSISNENVEFNLITQRQPDRIYKIIESCRGFCQWKKYKNASLFKVTNRFRASVNNYNNSLPKYITVDEFVKIIDYVKTNVSYSLEMKLKLECMIRLMYECGLRVGEVLGLTLEDFTYVNGDYPIIIRNRYTDKREQCAKTVMKVHDRAIYETNTYYTQGVGFQLAFCKRALYHQIQRYIDIAHLEKAKLPTYAKSIADKVDDDPSIKENHYLFLNDYLGGPYLINKLYDELKAIYKDCGIDYQNATKNNLAHRFRHGFIMRLLYVEKMQPERIIKYSRHTSVKGLEPYNKPTLEDLQEHYNKLEELIEEK